MGNTPICLHAMYVCGLNWSASGYSILLDIVFLLEWVQNLNSHLKRKLIINTVHIILSFN